MTRRADLHRFVALILMGFLFLAGTSEAREVVPAPPGGGSGLTLLPEDNAPPAPGASPRSPAQEEGFPDVSGTRDPDLGGEDYLFPSCEAWYEEMDIAPDGGIYVAKTERGDSGNLEVNVWRSTDSGATFTLWGSLRGADRTYWADDLRIVDGGTPMLLMTYRYSDVATPVTQVRLVRSPLGESADFSVEIPVMDVPDVRFHSSSFDTDVSGFSDFYVYVVASGHEGYGQDIWFARSTNQGESFETPYMIAELTVPDRYYVSPDISYGFGGHLHAAWSFNPNDDDTLDYSLRYRHVDGFASGGLGSWDYWQTMTSSSDGVDDRWPAVHAARGGPDVFLGYSRSWDGGRDASCFVSDDDGSTFSPRATIHPTGRRLGNVVEDVSTGIWSVGLNVLTDYGYSTAHVSDLTTWSAPLFFSDVPSTVGSECDIALDPTHGNRPALLWSSYFWDENDPVYFDAAWRDGPGWPILEEGFPLSLTDPPISAPALVDLDQDGDLEIVFSDASDRIQVLRHDGRPVPGWPVFVNEGLSDGPVAVGDLNGDGEAILCVGGADGNAYAYDLRGNLLPGWPSAITPPGHDVYVSIGAVGAPYPRSIVCAGANYVTLRNRRGKAPPGTYGWSTSSSDFTAPPAIGDIDGDGIAEIVCGLGATVFAFQKGVPAREFLTTLPAEVSDALTLGDLDLDGDLEILCPTAEGQLHALDHTGAQLGGAFPYDSGYDGPLTSASLARLNGSGGPEIVFGSRFWTLYALNGDGTGLPGYPLETTVPWYLFGAPILGRVAAGSNIAIGDRGEHVWGLTNGGSLVEGWPRNLGAKVNVSPAMGDVDLDGNNEIVVLTETQLHIFDVRVPPTGALYTWGMDGHDPQRTGCADCPEDLVTAVDGTGPSLTRVGFAGPTPNPAAGATRFDFAVPLRATVDLEVMDLRGRRVATVFREEMGPGEGFVTWDGCDASGRPVGAGHYMARLRVYGPGVSEELTRKVTVVR